MSKDWMAALEANIPQPEVTGEETSYIEEASYDKEEVTALAQQDVNMLAAIAMPTVFKYLFPPVLLAAWQLLIQSVTKPRYFPQIALGIPRGHAKTTLIKLFILFCILFTNKKFILIIASTSTLAENILADVADMLNETNIIRCFGDWKFGSETNRNDLKKFGFKGRNIILAAIGAGGSMRGLNLKNERPDIMIFEDIQTRECADSKEQSDSLLRWMLGTAMKAKSPHGCMFIFVGNMYPTTNSILKQLKSNPKWIKFISGAILADGSALWQELRPLESLLEELDNDLGMGHPEIFFAEVLNDTDAGVNNKVDLSAIRDWDTDVNIKPQGKFIIIDPSANKRGGDDVAIGYFEVYDGIPGMVDVLEERLSPKATIMAALLIAIKTKTRLIAVESTAYQYTLLYWFEEIAKELGITGIEFVEVYTGSYSKNARITDALKQLTDSTILIHKKVKSKVMFQISNWKPLKRDNEDGILDLLAYAPKVLELYQNAIYADDDIEVLVQGTEGIEQNNHAF